MVKLVSVEEANIPNIDFGINKRPEATDKSTDTLVNPGGDTQVEVPTLEGDDIETPDDLIYSIISLPDNAKLYCDGTEITESDLNKTCEPDKLTVDPEDGEQTVTFEYTTTDPEGAVSEPATVTIPFSDLLISGNVYDDGDGDNNVSGVAISAPDGVQLYVTLLDSNNNVVASKAVLSGGDYSFDGNDGLAADSDYTLVLSTEVNSTTASLPENWNNTGENVNSLGIGNDGVADGKIAIKVESDNITAIDFGINKKPIAIDKIEVSQVNPGGDNQVAVPTLEGNDTETPNDLIFKIISLPG